MSSNHIGKYTSDDIFLQDLEEMVCRFTPDGTITYVNACEAHLLNHKPSELLGQKISQFIPEKSALILNYLLSTLSSKYPTMEYEYQYISSDGKLQWQLWKIRGRFNSDGQLDEVQAVGRDNSLKKQYQELLDNNQQKAWQKSEDTFRQLTDTAPALIFIIQKYRYCYVNAFFQTVLEYTEEELLNMDSLKLVHPDDRVQVMDGLLELQKGNGRLFRQDIKIIPKSGRVCWIDFSASIIEWEGKLAVIGVSYDLTQHKQIQAALIQSENNFRSLAYTAPALIYVLRGSRLIYLNRAYEEITGYSREECLEMDAWDFIHPQYQDWVRGMALARQRGEEVPSRYQTRMQTKDGREIWAEFSVSHIILNGEPAILGVAIDITEQKRAQDQIRYLSYHDKLTGLHNRAYGEEKLKELDDDKNLPLSLILGDVNGLKMVNDAFGHQSGDILLQTAAKTLITCCHKKDLIVRWGGDEFVIILPGSDEEQARQVCQKIYQSCAQLKNVPIQLSIALGVACKNAAGKSMETVYKEAEDLMYRNKMLENRSNRSAFLNSLEQTLWVRSHETQEHTLRLRRLVVNISQALHLPADELNNLSLLAALHDIGKIAIPNSILDKAGKLSCEEWELMKRHPETGYRIALASPELSPIAEAILAHHERWDGSGYPLGLKDNDIPLISRILSLADAYDVMISGRPYQKEIGSEEALQEILHCAGSQFDPHLASLFVNVVSSMQSNLA
ncbi:MAG: hypothetical protein CVU90_08655 [Firmicutes bacterium HGW-Firmicutes-15]|nr:MAG: hypothetical protein CVU90_08655 [Firmicutes bacterium HGW-Firmicutes-15]